MTVEHFTRYFEELLLIKLRGRVKSMPVIDDIRQEVFLRVFRTLGSEDGIRDGRKLGAFVNAVCNNVLLEHFRSSSRTEALGDEHETVVDPAVSPDEALATKENEVRISRVLDGLPPKDAKILREIFLREKDKDEICRMFGVDREYLRVLVHRAKDKFRAMFRILYGTPPDGPPTRPRETNKTKSSLQG